jgi:hypothetical protein
MSRFSAVVRGRRPPSPAAIQADLDLHRLFPEGGGDVGQFESLRMGVHRTPISPLSPRADGIPVASLALRGCGTGSGRRGSQRTCHSDQALTPLLARSSRTWLRVVAVEDDNGFAEERAGVIRTAPNRCGAAAVLLRTRGKRVNAGQDYAPRADPPSGVFVDSSTAPTRRSRTGHDGSKTTGKSARSERLRWGC